jgi:hypothetical protein
MRVNWHVSSHHSLWIENSRFIRACQHLTLLDDRHRRVALFTLLMGFEQRVIIRFLYREGVNTNDIPIGLSAQFRDAGYRLRTVHRWCQYIRQGRELLYDEPRSGGPPIDLLDIKIMSQPKKKPFHSAYSLAELLSVSPTTILNHLRDSLGMQLFHLYDGYPMGWASNCAQWGSRSVKSSCRYWKAFEGPEDRLEGIIAFLDEIQASELRIVFRHWVSRAKWLLPHNGDYYHEWNYPKQKDFLICFAEGWRHYLMTPPISTGFRLIHALRKLVNNPIKTDFGVPSNRETLTVRRVVVLVSENDNTPLAKVEGDLFVSYRMSLLIWQRSNSAKRIWIDRDDWVLTVNMKSFMRVRLSRLWVLSNTFSIVHRRFHSFSDAWI